MKSIKILLLLVFSFTLFLVHCVNEDNVVTLSGIAVNPRYPAGHPNRIFKGSEVEKLEARPGSTEELVSKDAFIPTVTIEESGAFDISINKVDIGSLFLSLKNGATETERILTFPYNGISSSTNVGEVFFIQREHINFTLCWQGARDLDIHVVNATSRDWWVQGGTKGPVAEAVVDFSTATLSGCESVTVLSDTNSRYYVAARVSSPGFDPPNETDIDFELVAKPRVFITYKAQQVIIDYGPSTEEEPYKEPGVIPEIPILGTTGGGILASRQCDIVGTVLGRWWVAGYFEGGKVNVVNYCVKDSISQTIPDDLLSAIQNKYPLL